MNFRSYLNYLDQTKNLTRIKKIVSTEYEMAGIIDGLGEKPVFFEKVKESSISVVAGLVSSKEIIARALNLKKAQLLHNLSSALENPLSPQVVEKGECQEIVE